MKFQLLLKILLLTSTLYLAACGKDDPISSAASSIDQASLGTSFSSPIDVVANICALESRQDGTYLVCEDGQSYLLAENITIDESVKCVVNEYEDRYEVVCDGQLSQVVPKGSNNNPSEIENPSQTPDDNNDPEGEIEIPTIDPDDNVSVPEFEETRKQCRESCKEEYPKGKERRNCLKKCLKEKCHKKKQKYLKCTFRKSVRNHEVVVRLKCKMENKKAHHFHRDE